MVRGIAVRARGIGPMLCAVCQIIWWGGRVRIMEAMCEQARADAAAEMLVQARQRGCNAVVGVRYDGTALGPVSEIICYGTAVRVEAAAAPGGAKCEE